MLLLPARCRSVILICCVRKFVIGFEIALFHFCLYGSKLLALANVILFSSCMFRVQNESLIRVIFDMFSTPFRTFELPCYAARLANLLAEAPSPAPIRTRSFNKLVEGFLDIDVEEGEDSDRHASPSC